MKRFWNWLLGRQSAKVVYPFMDMQRGLRQAIADYRPELLDEFNALGSMPISNIGLFLDRHFPRDDVPWGRTSATQAHVNLRRYLEHANVGR